MNRRLRTASRPSIAILAIEGWALRSWALSGFVETVTREADVLILTPQAERARQEYPIPGVGFHEAATPRLGRTALTVLRIGRYAQAYRRQSSSDRALLARRYDGWPLRSRLRQDLIRKLARLAKLPPPLEQAFEKLTLGLMAESRRLEPVLSGVDLVFSTLPLVSHYERPALWAAQRLGIKTACMVTSWDNLTAKARFPVEFAHYLVWSEHMRNELLSVFPNVEPECVTITGPPQFDFYAKPDLQWSREEFCRRVGADPERPIILWAGVSPNLMPNEPELVADFCQAVRGGRVTGSPQVLLRPHPIGGGSRFAEMRRCYPDLLFTETNANHPDLIGWMPSLDEMALLVSSIAHCAVNINFNSTMTLDCCALDRPVVNITYDTEPGSVSEQQIIELAHFEHYSTILQAGGVRTARSLDDLITHVNAYLADPTLDRAGRAAALALQCGSVDGRNAARAAEAVLSLVRRHPKAQVSAVA